MASLMHRTCGLQKMQDLKVLALIHVHLDPGCIQEMAVFQNPILKLPKLESLVLASTGLLHLPIQRLVHAPNLTTLTTCNEGPFSHDSQPEAWQLPTTLHRLNLDFSLLPTPVDPSLYGSRPSIAFSLCRQLRALVVNYICCIGMDRLFDCIKSLPHLQLLTTSGCGCTRAYENGCCGHHTSEDDSSGHSPASGELTQIQNSCDLNGSSNKTCDQEGRYSEAGHFGSPKCSISWQSVLLRAITNPTLRTIILAEVELSYWPPYTKPLPVLDWHVDSLGNMGPSLLPDGAVIGMIGLLQRDANVMRAALGFHHLEVVVT